MKLPRDLSGADLVKALQKVGYVVTRQKAHTSASRQPGTANTTLLCPTTTR